MGDSSCKKRGDKIVKYCGAKGEVEAIVEKNGIKVFKYLSTDL